MPPGAYCADAPTPSFHYLSFSDRQVPTWFRWRKSGRRAESESGGDGLLANPRIVARRRYQPFGRRHRNRSGGFCCFSPSKSREKSFLCTFGAKSTKSLRTSFSAGLREPRRCTGRARSGLCATPWRTRRSSPPLFPRQTRVRICCAAVGGKGYDKNKYVSATCAFFYPARRFPTWFRWRESGRKTESASGGDGLLANPRSRPTPLSAFRTPTSESVGWLLLLFATEKQRKKKKFSHVLLGPKVPKASARRFPRDCASRGAARGAQDQAYAPPRGGRAAARPLFFRVKRECGFVVPPLAAKDMIKINTFRQRVLFFTPQGDSRLGSDGGKADEGLKARAAGTVCLQTRAVARRRYQPFGRRHRNRSGGFCCFSPSKSREKSFLCTFGAKSTKSLRTSFSAGVREPRRCTGRARSGLCATPWRTRRSSPPLFPRQTRVRICCAAVGGKGYDKNKYVSATCAFFYPARRFPTWFRWRESGRRAESESGGDGLLANPRSRPTPLSAFRTPTSESVGWLLLLFAIEKQVKKKKFSARRPKIAKGFRENFCCFSLLKSSKKKKWRGADNR